VAAPWLTQGQRCRIVLAVIDSGSGGRRDLARPPLGYSDAAAWTSRQAKPCGSAGPEERRSNDVVHRREITGSPGVSRTP
jgi:hypothetical protein